MEGIPQDVRTESPAQRQLAAVMFADIMGYTAMMQEDEQQAMNLRARMRKTIDYLIPLYNGRIVQYYGDGVLSMFGSASQGVKCAVEIQKEFQNEPKVPVRIGLHSGDIWIDDQNIYGDCVNIASRIEALSTPGAVLVSDKVYDEIKNQTELTATSLGNFTLKNVKRQVGVYAITSDNMVVPSSAQLGVRAGKDKSIAVLPFINMSADPENEYFSDGISEEILNALSRVDGLQVCSRSSSFTFKGKSNDVREVGQKLGVSTVLEGSVRRAGNKVRISVQLINSTDGYRIWSEVYDNDNDLDDIFRVQDEISAKIVNRLRENFALQQQHQPGEAGPKLPTDNIDAYNLYLKGRFHWNKSNPEDIQKAITAFEEAIVLDPDFALPYCMLSFCYSFMGSSGLIPRPEAFSKAKDCTLKAIELDPQHPESHLSMATIKFFQNWDFKGAEVSLDKAINLGLNSSLLNQVHGMVLISKGRFDEAIEKMNAALHMDPLSLPLMSHLADAYAFAKRFDEALAQYDKIIELDPSFRRAFEGKGYIYIAKGEYENAIVELERYHKLVGHPLKGLSPLVHAHAMAGNTEKALEYMDKVRLRQEQEPNVNLDLEFAFMYSGFKDFDKVFYHLNRTYEERMGIACNGFLYCVRYPMLQEMKADERFDALLKRIGLE